MFSTPGLNLMYHYILEQEKGTVPGYVTVDVPTEDQYKYQIGPVARVAPDLVTGELSLHAGPAIIDLDLRVPQASMTSLVPAFKAFAQGGQFKMPHNLEISIPETRSLESEESMKQERLCLRSLFSKERTVTLFNPSKFVLAEAFSIAGTRFTVSSATEWEEQYRSEVARYPGVKYVCAPEVPAKSLVYAGSLGIVPRFRRWLVLQPKMTHPQVVGQQRHSWGISYQYRRRERIHELYFEWEPRCHRYSTMDVFGLETQFYVHTTEHFAQSDTPGKGRVLGFSMDGSRREAGNLGEILDNGLFVVRDDTIVPLRHTMYSVDNNLICYGEKPPPGECKAYDLQSHIWVTVDQCDLPLLRYATFYKRGEHSDKLFHRNFGSLLSAAVCHESDTIMADYGSGLVVQHIPLPAEMRHVPRDRAQAYLWMGHAVLKSGKLVKPRDFQVSVGGEVLDATRFLRLVMRSPVRRVNCDPDTMRYLRGLHFSLQKGVEGYVVYPPPVPLVGWGDLPLLTDQGGEDG